MTAHEAYSISMEAIHERVAHNYKKIKEQIESNAERGLFYLQYQTSFKKVYELLKITLTEEGYSVDEWFPMTGQFYINWDRKEDAEQ